jgi:hypothetical protein
VAKKVPPPPFLVIVSMPTSGLGQTRHFDRGPATINGHLQSQLACLKRANNRLVHAAFDHLVSTNVVGTSRRLGTRIAQNALGRVRLPRLRRLRCTHLLLYRLINDVLLHFRS